MLPRRSIAPCRGCAGCQRPRTSAACSTRRIASVYLKGPVLSEWLSGSAGFRRFSDLDILIAPGYHRRGSRPRALWLSTSGRYEHEHGSNDLWGPGRVAPGARGALSDGSSLPASHVSFAPALTAAEVIDDSCRPVGVPGCACRPDARRVAAVGPCVQHLWCTLEMLLAIARVMKRTDVDWERVRERALRAGGWNGCATGLALASELFAVPVPSPQSLRRTSGPANSCGRAHERRCSGPTGSSRIGGKSAGRTARRSIDGPVAFATTCGG